jgi:hypothetical protein
VKRRGRTPIGSDLLYRTTPQFAPAIGSTWTSPLGEVYRVVGLIEGPPSPRGVERVEVWGVRE